MADEVFKIKQGDRRPYLKGQLVTRDNDGEVEGPQELTGGTVRFSMRSKATGTTVISKQPATVIDPITAEVQYEWQAGDTDVVGDYIGEFEVTFGGETETFPNFKQGFKIKITEQLA